MALRHRYTPSSGYTQLISPQTQPIERLDFGILQLGAGQTYEVASGATATVACALAELLGGG